MSDNTFKVKYNGKKLKVRRQGRDETIVKKSLQVLPYFGTMTDEELKTCNQLQPSMCVGDPISMFDERRIFLEVLSIWYPGESTNEGSETARKKRIEADINS